MDSVINKSVHFAIAEDEPAIRSYLTLHIIEAFRKHNYRTDCAEFSDGNSLLQSILKGNTYDILFLDIEMPGLNGIKLSSKIRELGLQTLIVFISNKSELVFQSFEVRPFRFIRKNHFLEELAPLTRDLIYEMTRNEEKAITIEEEKSTAVYSFHCNEIQYIEVNGKHCKVITNKETVSLRQTLSLFETKLNNQGFIKPHRSYLVNHRYISRIEKNQIVLENGAVLPLSRNRITETRAQFISLKMQH